MDRGECLRYRFTAKAIGSRVYRAQGLEIGWFPDSRVAHHGQYCGAEIGSGRFEQAQHLHLGPAASFDEAGMALRGVLDWMAQNHGDPVRLSESFRVG